MGEVFGRATWKVLAGLVGASLVTLSATAQSQGEPPGRVGRLAFVDGTVSFHDDEQSGWTKAIVNTPLTTGDAIWTEPNARSEVSVAGTRIRMDGSTELDMLQIDDEQVRLQLAQGRIDVKTFTMDAAQPYEIVTPRGTVTLQQQGDYYVEAGSMQDPTRLGVRSGAAQIQGLNGQVLAVRAGEVGEVFGDGNSLQLKAIQAAPPAPAASWAARDRQVVYDQQPQYVPAGMTGYEDLNAYGNWINDGSYGQVWVPRSTPAGWAPYRTGHWSYVKPWGWTWIDEQPWGFAPYHYGRWANSNNRWVWVPPQREQRPVYAPALVAFVGGLELAAQLGNQGRTAGPVGWFPLGPREAYVPPYSTNRDYYQRINRSAQIQDRDLNDRWERAQRREAYIAGQNSVLANQRFATVVPSQTFVRSQPVQRAALTVTADQMAKAAVAPVSAPPAPTASVAAAVDGKTAAKPETTDTKRPGDAKAAAEARTAAEAKAKSGDIAVGRTAVADMPTLARPTRDEKQTGPKAPGPKFVSTDTKAGADAKPKTAESPDVKTAKPATPPLQPRQGAAPPALKETKAAPEQGKQEPGKPAANQPKEAAPAPPKPALASPDSSPAKRDEPKPNEPKQAAPAPEKPNAPQSRPDSRQDERKQAAPDQQKPNTAPQPKQDEPKQVAPAPKPAATPQPRQEEPRQAAPQPAPKPEAAPRQEAPRQAAPQPRAEPPQQAQPPRPQPQQQQPQQVQPPRAQPQPQQQQAPKDKETRAPAPQQQQQQQIAQPPKAEPPQQQQPQRGGGGGGNKKDKD